MITLSILMFCSSVWSQLEKQWNSMINIQGTPIYFHSLQFKDSVLEAKYQTYYHHKYFLRTKIIWLVVLVMWMVYLTRDYESGPFHLVMPIRVASGGCMSLFLLAGVLPITSDFVLRHLSVFQNLLAMILLICLNVIEFLVNPPPQEYPSPSYYAAIILFSMLLYSSFVISC